MVLYKQDFFVILNLPPQSSIKFLRIVLVRVITGVQIPCCSVFMSMVVGKAGTQEYFYFFDRRKQDTAQLAVELIDAVDLAECRAVFIVSICVPERQEICRQPVIIYRLQHLAAGRFILNYTSALF